MFTITRKATGYDYHVHSYYSDGEFPPSFLLVRLQSAGIRQASIADHDTFAGVRMAQKAAQLFKIKYMTGGELSAVNARGKEVHILAYAVKPERISPEFNRELCAVQLSARERIQKMCRLSVDDPIVLERKSGGSLDLSMNFALLERLNSKRPRVECRAVYLNDGTMLRPLVEKVNKFLRINKTENGVNVYHLLNLLRGYPEASNRLQEFLQPFNAELSLNDQEPKTRWAPENYTPHWFSAKQAIEFIREAGGVAGPAHPAENNMTLAELSELVSYGAQLIEVYSSKHTEEQTAKYLQFSLDKGLLRSIGTDYHGPIMTPHVCLGEVFYCEKYPTASIEEIEALADKR